MIRMKRASCQHCNNEIQEFRDSFKNENGVIADDNYFYDMQVILFCPSCENYNVINAYWDHSYGLTETTDEYDIYEGAIVEESYLYPIPSNLIAQKYNMVPKEIINNFEKAIKLKKIDEESCLAKLRKTLEIVCNDQSAEGDRLVDMISFLSETGVLPKTLNSASTLTRKLGNIGVHEANVKIDTAELKIVIELVEYIIQYIYVLPKEIEKLENRFNLTESNKEKN